MQEFIQSTGLVDQYNDKFPEPIRTYIYGGNRLDYILVNPGLVDAIESIGYLETHEGAYTDHVYAYVDFTEAKLFQGLINRPVPVHSREFMLAQTDKKLAFQKEMIKNIKHNQTKERVILLARTFIEGGHTEEQ